MARLPFIPRRPRRPVPTTRRRDPREPPPPRAGERHAPGERVRMMMMATSDRATTAGRSPDQTPLQKQ
ncbi:hypothetical protein NL676_020637 [Syzygium grande]|nr:hypothetical protein NL676_020637 [Syzygium grande]